MRHSPDAVDETQVLIGLVGLGKCCGMTVKCGFRITRDRLWVRQRIVGGVYASESGRVWRPEINGTGRIEVVKQ